LELLLGALVGALFLSFPHSSLVEKFEGQQSIVPVWVESIYCKSTWALKVLRLLWEGESCSGDFRETKVWLSHFHAI